MKIPHWIRRRSCGGRLRRGPTSDGRNRDVNHLGGSVITALRDVAHIGLNRALLKTAAPQICAEDVQEVQAPSSTSSQVGRGYKLSTSSQVGATS